jgi:hypothetical protein
MASCFQTLRDGTDYVVPNRIGLVLTGDSTSVRLLQLADVIVGSTLSYVGGESEYSAPIFRTHVKPMLRKELGRIGGVGLKIHPDYLYANLYHWLLGDSHWVRAMSGQPLPRADRSYAASPNTP